MAKPSSKERKRLRARLQNILYSFWGHTERQVVMRKINGAWQDTQSVSVLNDIEEFRNLLDDIEAAYK